MESYENRAIRMLLQPSIHLYSILNYYNDENKNIILNHLVNEQIDDLIIFINQLIENIQEDKEGGMCGAHENEYLSIQLQLRLFITELRESYAHIRDLLYHKKYSDVRYAMPMLENILQNNVVNVLINELKENNIVIPENVLVGILDKVQQGVKQALTPNDESPIYEGLSQAQIKRKADKLKKLNKSVKK
ncbi:hypothetical protein [Sphingobacterium daejeonense]|uniref:hypothetical protein n=1 Tax=Sphingobacterium daejeonense TaxID=371142 RepID=UPI003D312A69